MIVEETNAIGTAYLRLDLLPPAAQPALRERFRQYVEARLAAYRQLPDIAAAQTEERRAMQIQGGIWRQAVAACQEAGVPPTTMLLLLPALNAMMDLTTTRTLATRMHPPTSIFGMLFGLALASALLAGYGMAGTQRTVGSTCPPSRPSSRGGCMSFSTWSSHAWGGADSRPSTKRLWSCGRACSELCSAVQL